MAVDGVNNEIKMEEIISILPPVFASVAGLIPLLLKSSPIKLEKSVSSLVSIIFVTAIWVLYLLILMAGNRFTFFSPTISVISLLLGLLFLIVLLVLVTRNNPSALLSGAIFVFGALLILTGFTNHVASESKTVFLFYKSEKCNNFSVNWVDKNSQLHKLGVHKGIFRYGIAWEVKDVSNEIKQFKMICDDETVSIALKDMHFYKWGMGDAYVYEK